MFRQPDGIVIKGMDVFRRDAIVDQTFRRQTLHIGVQSVTVDPGQENGSCPVVPGAVFLTEGEEPPRIRGEHHLDPDSRPASQDPGVFRQIQKVIGPIQGIPAP